MKNIDQIESVKNANPCMNYIDSSIHQSVKVVQNFRRKELFLPFSFIHLLAFPASRNSIDPNHLNMKPFLTILLLVVSNIFMTFAWYGHLKFKSLTPEGNMMPLFAVILISWGLAFFEYCFQVPANRIGFDGNGGPFNLWQLKVLQEVITLVVFTIFTTLVFKNESFRINHLIGFFFLILAVYFIFKK